MIRVICNKFWFIWLATSMYNNNLCYLLFAILLNFLIVLLRCCAKYLSILLTFAVQTLNLNSFGLCSTFNYFNIEPHIVFGSWSNIKSSSLCINLTFENRFSRTMVRRTILKPHWPCNSAADRSAVASYVNSDTSFVATLITLGVFLLGE